MAWHCDTIHAVDNVHNGSMDASVFYIPVVPKSRSNDQYIETQKQHFLKGIPAPDFPGGAGESNHVGRATKEDIAKYGDNALTAMGFA